MPIDERWQHLDSSDWDSFARSWLRQLHDSPEDSESKIGLSVVMMNFTATPEQQWRFILSAVAQAETDDQLGHIAAGPMEHLLGHHGAGSMLKVEAAAAADPKFVRMLTQVWQYMMTDELWEWLQTLIRHYSDTASPPAES